MDLKPFVRTLVRPGQPLTAQAWNDVVDGIDAAHQFLRASLHTVKVHITNQDLDVRAVRVTATRNDGPPIESVAPLDASGDHVLSHLDAGAWVITASAAGFRPASTPLVVADAGETTIALALEASANIMPDVFGLPLGTAMAALADSGIAFARLLDFEGTEYAPANPGPEQAGQPVLAQSPLPGTLIDASQTAAGATLVIAVPAKLEAVVEVPSVAGLTQAEAKQVLEKIGLRLGKVTILQPRG
jgi:hypothetical protein